MPLDFIPTRFAEAWRIQPGIFRDERGFFMESYARREFESRGIAAEFVQDNYSLSKASGVLRGLHFQLPPCTQAKLVRVVRGAIFDVIVDLRIRSPTYGKWESFELTADNFTMLYIPRGFAHGFCTLRPDTEFTYKVDAYYSAPHDCGIRWNDPTLAIPWPVETPVLSGKDSALPLFDDFDSPF